MNWLREENGYGLVESLVALSLLLGILVPLALFLVFIGGNTIAKDKITGFNHVRNQMELVIAQEVDSSFVFQPDSNWWVKTEIYKEGDLYNIQVSAFKKDTSSAPTIELETSRLWYKD